MFKSPIEFGKVRFAHKGTFDMNRVLNVISDWINSHEYDYSEKENAEKAVRRGTEAVIKFNGERKITEHLLFSIDGEINTYQMKRKGKLQTGELVVKIAAELQMDYKEEWETSQFMAFLLFLYHNTIMRPTIRRYVEKLDVEFSQLQDVTKEAMELYT